MGYLGLVLRREIGTWSIVRADGTLLSALLLSHSAQ